MKRTIIHGLIAGLSASMLVACGSGSTDTSSASSSKYLADGEACNAAWVSTTAYNGGALVSRSGRNYTAAFWTQNQDPVTNSGPAGSGQPWIPGYLCGSTPTPAPTPTPTPAPTPTPTPAPTPAPTPTPTPAPTPAPTPTPTPAPTPAPTPTPTPAPTPAPTPTGSCPQFVNGHTYATGDKVTNVGNYYQCTVGGWCSLGGAYEPGVGWAWQNAWSQITASQCGATPTPAPTPTPTPTPTPAPTPTPTPTPTPAPTPTPTPAPTPTPTGMKTHVLVGYLHASFANGSGYIPMANVSNDWDVIDLSFAEPDSVTSGNVHFNRCSVSECPNVESDAAFLSAIKAKQAAGKKVLISIGGANGEVQLTTTGARDAFVSSVSAIIDKWGLDGLDVDFEGHSLYLNTGDNDYAHPTTPVVVNLISALRTLQAKYGSKFVLTMAPETLLTQGGHAFWGAGKFGGADPRNGVYLAVLYGVRDILTYVNVQDYNSGAIQGSNDVYYNSGTVDFNVALTDMMITGFTLEHDATRVWPGLRADQVGFGLPANNYAAGSGQMSVTDTTNALNCLIKGTGCGSYKPAATHPTLRSLMTWSINWDAFTGNAFSTPYAAYFRSLGN